MFEGPEHMEMISFTTIEDQWKEAAADLEPCFGNTARFLAGKPMDHRSNSE